MPRFKGTLIIRDVVKVPLPNINIYVKFQLKLGIFKGVKGQTQTKTIIGDKAEFDKKFNFEADIGLDSDKTLKPVLLRVKVKQQTNTGSVTLGTLELNISGYAVLNPPKVRYLLDNCKSNIMCGLEIQLEGEGDFKVPPLVISSSFDDLMSEQKLNASIGSLNSCYSFDHQTSVNGKNKDHIDQLFRK